MPEEKASGVPRLTWPSHVLFLTVCPYLQKCLCLNLGRKELGWKVKLKLQTLPRQTCSLTVSRIPGYAHGGVRGPLRLEDAADLDKLLVHVHRGKLMKSCGFTGFRSCGGSCVSCKVEDKLC